jgi:hypothetical protein
VRSLLNRNRSPASTAARSHLPKVSAVPMPSFCVTTVIAWVLGGILRQHTHRHVHHTPSQLREVVARSSHCPILLKR